MDVMPSSPGTEKEDDRRPDRKGIDYCELHRRFDLVRRARFNTSSRWEIHHRLSQWVVALLSVGLLFITTWSPLRAYPKTW